MRTNPRDPGRPAAPAAILAALLMCGFLACAHAPQPVVPAPGAAAGGAWPRKVAVLPFENRSDNPEAAVVLRRMFYNFFSSLNYLDLEPAAVDASLAADPRGKNPTASGTPDWPRLGSLLGVDAVVVGEVLSYGQVYALLYANQQAGLRARMVECATGRTLWELEHKVTLHEGDLPLSLPGLAAAIVKTALSFQQASLMRAAAELCMQMTATLPNPEPADAESAPRIQVLVHNAASRLLVPGDTFKAVMLGESRCSASLSLPPLWKELPMEEKEPGVYVAAWRIRPGDRLLDGRLTGTLRSAGGAGRQWIDTLGPIHIGQPTALPAAIKRSTVLRAAEGPYLAREAVVVSPGATLTIEPGTVVWFSRLGLIVRGRIEARGTADQPVLISGPAGSGWKGVLIESVGGENSFRHCRISGAEAGLKAARSHVKIENCRFQENLWGLVMEEGRLEIDRSLVRASAKAGISARSAELALTGSTVSENSRGGLLLENTRAFIVGNNIANNGAWGLKVTDGRAEVQAAQNWWGSESPEIVEAVKGPAAIRPWLTQPAALAF